MNRIRSAACIAFFIALVLLQVSCGSSNSGPSLTTIDIAPISPIVLVGGTQQFTATGHFSDGTSSNLTAQANWSSDNTAVATIQNLGTHPGLATAKATGMANITVSFAQGSSTVNASTNLEVNK